MKESAISQVEPIETDFAFRPSLVKRRYGEFKDFGFNDFEAYSRTYDIARRDLTYYFLEHFARKDLVGFEYHFEKTDDGAVDMVSTHYERFGDVCDMFSRACDERKKAGLDFSREEAELEGVRKIKSSLLEEDRDATVLLVSPPPEESKNRPGYGDYSFVYFGKYDRENKKLSMLAWRNKMTFDEQKKIYRDFSKDEDIFLEGPDDFLRNPAFQFGEEGKYAFDRLRFMSGSKIADFEEYRGAIDQATVVLVDLAASGASYQRLNIAQADIELDFVEAIEGGRDLKIQTLPRMESFRSDAEAYVYVEARKRDMESKYDLSGYSSGGCGRSMFASLANGNSSSVLIPGLAVPDLAGSTGREFSSHFICPKCSGKIESGRGITTCPHCGFTKEQAAKEMGVAC